MRSLARSLRVEGEPVEVPWPGLRDLVKPRPGNLVVIQAAPGVGKSTLALLWALKVGRPTLYGSWDTTLQEQAIRAAAHLSGQKTNDIEGDPAGWSEWLWDRPEPLRFIDLTMTYEDLHELVAAETEFFGGPPALIIVDNAGDLLATEESVGEYRRVFSTLKRIARKTKSVVIALHHLHRKSQKQGEETDQSTKVVRLQDSLYTGDQITEIVLGLWRPREDLMRIGVLKNRMGRADPTGKLYVDFQCDLGKASIEAHIWRPGDPT